MSASIGSTAPGDAMIGDSWPRMGGYTIDIYIYTKHFFLSIFPQNLTLAQFDVYVYIYIYIHISSRWRACRQSNISNIYIYTL